MNKKQAFTLIEILIVIVVIGIISSFIIVGLSSLPQRATIAKGQAFSSSLKNALMINLIAEYRLDNDATDFWGGHTVGTISGAAYYASCVQSGCYSFDGADDYIELADATDLRLTTGGTISAWIYPETLGETAGRILDKSTTATATNGYAFYVGGTNRLGLLVNAGTETYSSNNSINLNKWQLATVSFNSSGRKIYVNGVDVTSSGGSETALPPSVAGVVRIGQRVTATDYSFDGYIDEVRIYNAVASVFQIEQDYYTGLNRLLKDQKITLEEHQQRIFVSSK